ncbi:MAG: hypothetical protein Q9211_001395 [Gyalolechia sp. 1 TL-2023]
MTSNTSGIQWVPRSLDPFQTRFFQQLPQPLLRHQLKSGTEEHPSRSDAEPAFKKQRLDYESDRTVFLSASQVQHTELVDSHGVRPREQPVDGTFFTQPESPSPASLVFPVRSTPVSRKNRRQYDEANISRNNRKLGGVQIKPFVLEPPSPAPKYSSSCTPIKLGKNEVAGSSHSWSCEVPADFSPWRGNHTEDVLSESTIKQGCSDKIQVSQAESCSAKTPIWSALKHKSGLQVISSLFVSVLDQRQAHGTTTASCTFKPPPRVGLTDSKREAWLRDLSNPNIPLRRLSRTIPYGIRGRALLDQFLAKNIPTARSLWLAKCVGANEIRAFKRKGASGAFAAGGETKWIKDWTANVEQFLDGIISTCSTQGWTGNLTYGVRLTTHLLAEGLLDRDQYFEWLLDAVKQSGLDALSIYLLMVRTHLDELGRSRRLGRQLAESLVRHLHKIMHLPTSSHYSSLRSEIVDIIRRFTLSSPASFLLPKCWHEYESTLQPIFGVPGTTLYVNFQKLCKRNMRLQTLAGLKDNAEITTSWAIIKSLDSLSADIQITKLAENLRNIADDSELLVHVCLEWSASIHKQGRARIYIAARLLRNWSEKGIDVETFILNFLADKSSSCGLEKSSLYKVINELIRSRHFSTGKYLQWIIANGMLRRYDQFEKEPPCAMGLIFEISPYGIPTHALNLRQNLLRSIGVSTKDEERRIVEKKTSIERQFHSKSQQHLKSRDFEDLSSDLSRESSIVKSVIGRWIWRELMIHQGAQHAFNKQSSAESQSNPHPSSYLCHDVAQFRIVLGVLEDVEDFSTLADVLVHYSFSHDPRLLADVTIIVSHYLDIFKAIGIARTLFSRLFRRHVLLHHQPMVAPFTKALVDLGGSLPSCFNETRILQKYLKQFESKLSIAAFSPISEHMTEALQTGDSATVSAYADEVEQLLSSGSSLDKRILTDVFESIWSRFEATWVDPGDSGFAVASLISRLASFDVAAVNALTIHWVEKTLALPSRPKLMQIGIPLISARLITLEQLLSKALRLLQDEHRPTEYRDLLLELLGFLTADREKAEWSMSSVSRRGLHTIHELMSSQLRYRFYAEQQRFLRGCPPVMVSILQHVLRYAHTTPGDSIAHIAKLLQDSRFLSLLRTLSDSDAPNFERINSVLGSIVTMEGAGQTLSRIMSLAEDEGMYITLQGKLLALWRHVGILTLPFRRLYLQAILNETSESNEDVAYHLTSILLDNVSTSSAAETHQWVNLMSALPPEQMKMIREKAEAELFVLLSQKCEPPRTSLRKRLDCLLSVIERTGKEAHSALSATRILVRIHEKLAQLIPVQYSPELRSGRQTGLPATVELEEPPKRMKLNALLRLIHIHQSAFHTPNVSDSAVLHLLLFLSSFNNHPSLRPDTHLLDETYDFLIVVSDAVSPALLSRCIRTLLHRTTGASWLQMVTKKAPGGKAAQRPFPVRKWETMPDATPLMTENDTSVSLTLFGARKAVL